MASNIDSFEDRLLVYCDCLREPELRRSAYHALRGLEADFESWATFYELLPDGSEERRLALGEMVQRAQDASDWEDVYMEAPRGSSLESLARAKRDALRTAPPAGRPAAEPPGVVTGGPS